MLFWTKQPEMITMVLIEVRSGQGAQIRQRDTIVSKLKKHMIEHSQQLANQSMDSTK